MADDNILPVFQQILMDDSSINAACDGQVVVGTPGFELKDEYLEHTLQTAIMIRRLDKTQKEVAGSITTGEYLYDLLFQVDVLSLDSELRAYNLADLVEAKLRKSISKLFNGTTYKFAIFLNSRSPGFEEAKGYWYEMLRMRAIGYVSSA